MSAHWTSKKVIRTYTLENVTAMRVNGQEWV